MAPVNKGIAALQQWAKNTTSNYEGVHIKDMSSSWKDGLAFCAIIHSYHPDLIDFGSLSKENIYENNHLAFSTAEKLGIPALLDAEDMDVLPTPDRLSVITYVAQMYNHFKVMTPADDGSGAKRKLTGKKSGVDTISRMEPPAVPQMKRYSNSCHICSQRIYLMERVNIDGRFYHRGCFKCSKCDERLTVGHFRTLGSPGNGPYECLKHVQERELGLNPSPSARNSLLRKRPGPLPIPAAPTKIPSPSSKRFDEVQKVKPDVQNLGVRPPNVPALRPGRLDLHKTIVDQSFNGPASRKQGSPLTETFKANRVMIEHDVNATADINHPTMTQTEPSAVVRDTNYNHSQSPLAGVLPLMPTPTARKSREIPKPVNYVDTKQEKGKPSGINSTTKSAKSQVDESASIATKKSTTPNREHGISNIPVGSASRSSMHNEVLNSEASGPSLAKHKGMKPCNSLAYHGVGAGDVRKRSPKTNDISNRTSPHIATKRTSGAPIDTVGRDAYGNALFKQNNGPNVKAEPKRPAGLESKLPSRSRQHSASSSVAEKHGSKFVLPKKVSLEELLQRDCDVAAGETDTMVGSQHNVSGRPSTWQQLGRDEAGNTTNLSPMLQDLLRKDAQEGSVIEKPIFSSPDRPRSVSPSPVSRIPTSSFAASTSVKKHVAPTYPLKESVKKTDSIKWPQAPATRLGIGSSKPRIPSSASASDRTVSVTLFATEMSRSVVDDKRKQSRLTEALRPIDLISAGSTKSKMNLDSTIGLSKSLGNIANITSASGRTSSGVNRLNKGEDYVIKPQKGQDNSVGNLRSLHNSRSPPGRAARERLYTSPDKPKQAHHLSQARAEQYHYEKRRSSSAAKWGIVKGNTNKMEAVSPGSPGSDTESWLTERPRLKPVPKKRLSLAIPSEPALFESSISGDDRKLGYYSATASHDLQVDGKDEATGQLVQSKQPFQANRPIRRPSEDVSLLTALKLDALTAMDAELERKRNSASSTSDVPTYAELEFPASQVDPLALRKSFSNQLFNSRKEEETEYAALNFTDSSSGIAEYSKVTGITTSPQRRQVQMERNLPLSDILFELDKVDYLQCQLEVRGKILEEKIRNTSETDANSPEAVNHLDDWLKLVNEKNNLFRRETELVYMRREHALDELHSDIEYQLRCIAEKPDTEKSEADVRLEKHLMSRLIEVINQKNDVVDSQEEERKRQLAEDTGLLDLTKRLDDMRLEPDSNSGKKKKPRKTKKQLAKKIKA